VVIRRRRCSRRCSRRCPHAPDERQPEARLDRAAEVVPHHLQLGRLHLVQLRTAPKKKGGAGNDMVTLHVWLAAHLATHGASTIATTDVRSPGPPPPPGTLASAQLLPTAADERTRTPATFASAASQTAKFMASSSKALPTPPLTTRTMFTPSSAATCEARRGAMRREERERETSRGSCANVG